MPRQIRSGSEDLARIENIQRVERMFDGSYGFDALTIADVADNWQKAFEVGLKSGG